MLGQLIYTLIFSILLIYVSGIAFSFFGIGFEVYGNYMLWLIALSLFWNILPPKLTSTIF